MSAVAAAALAADLFERALPILAALPLRSTVRARAAALSAIDAFLDGPGPARHLAAVRALSALRRSAALARLDTSGAERAFRRGLEEVHGALGPAVAAELAVLGEGPPASSDGGGDHHGDRRAGARLLALAALAATRAELAARIATEAAALRSRLAFRPTPPPAEGRLAFAGRRKAARAARRARKR